MMKKLIFFFNEYIIQCKLFSNGYSKLITFDNIKK